MHVAGMSAVCVVFICLSICECVCMWRVKAVVFTVAMQCVVCLHACVYTNTLHRLWCQHCAVCGHVHVCAVSHK